MILRFDPGTQLLTEGRQIEQKMLGLFKDRHRAIHLRARVNQINRIELVTAGIALVATGILGATDWARPLNIAVGQSAARGRRKRPEGFLAQNIPLVVERLKEILGDTVVILGRRAREGIVAQAQIVQVVTNHLVVAVGDVAGGDALFIGSEGNRRTVFIRAADHQHVVATQTMEAGKNIGWHTEPGHMADMTRAVSVGPRHSHEDMLGHWNLSLRHVLDCRF